MINIKVVSKAGKLFAALFLSLSSGAFASCPFEDFAASEELHITGRIHFNINVSNFERSRQFYRLAGFIDQVGDFPETNTLEVSKGVGLDRLYRLKAELIYLGELPEGPIDLTVPTGRFIDLIEWLEPARSERPYAEINHLGISYFSLVAADLPMLVKRLNAAGGTIEAGPLNGSSGDQVVMMRDPDGTFVRLRQSSQESPKIDYLNINVSDLQCSKKFYAMLGLELEAPTGNQDNSLYQEIIGFDSGANIKRNEATLRHRVDGTKLKLSEWLQPSFFGKPYPPPINHLGAHRINWASSNLEADVALLKSYGVKFLSEIAPCCEGEASTFGFILFEDPDGIYNQLMGSIKPSAQMREAR